MNRVGPTRIVGLGAVTGYGWGVSALRDGLRGGRTAARPTEVDGVPVTAAIIPERGRGADDPDERYERAVGVAVREALVDAGTRGWQPGTSVAVIFSTGIGDIRTVRDNYFREARPRPSLFPRLLHTSAASLLSQEHGWTGPNLVLNAACSSGNAALQLAHLWLRSGAASDVIIVGAELCVIGEIVTGFRRMRVLLGEHAPLTDCRPFQEGSKGFFLGEAAIALVVSARADRGRADYLGGAATNDAFHLVAAEPEGRQLERCFCEALAEASRSPTEIGLVKAHGSGTPLNDSVEAALVDRLFPPETMLCSYKPLVGHCMAASALAELAALLTTYETGVLPSHVTRDAAHPRLPDAGAPPAGLVMCASVGLGGTNTAVVLDITTRRQE